MKAGASVHGDSEDAIRVFNTHASALGIRDAKLKIDPKAFDKARVGDPLFLEAIASVRSNQLPAPFNLSLSSSMSGGLIFYRKEGI